MCMLMVISLFTRDKWTQQPHQKNANDHSTIMTYDFWYNLNGEKKPWDVQVRSSQLRQPNLPVKDGGTHLTLCHSKMMNYGTRYNQRSRWPPECF